MAERHILLLHGLGVDHRMWSQSLGALRGTGRVLAPDLPGFGREPALAPESRTLNGYVEWLSRWLADTGAGPVALAGYSMGGTIAMLFALLHPEAVERLVLCCSSPCWGRGGRRWLGRVFVGVGGAAAMDLFQLSVRWGCSRYVAAEFQAAEIADMVDRAHRPSMIRLYRELVDLDLTPRLGELDMPVLVIGGCRDWLAPPAHLRLLCRGLPRGRLELVPAARHLLCLSHPARFTELLVRGLRDPAAVSGA